jgi:dTDP-glucose pyrophosphorylase
VIQPADFTVLIPAAGRVPEGVLALSNISCPAMIPVAGRPVIHWTLTYLRSLGLRRFRIAVARRGLSVEDFVECGFGSDCEIEFVVPARDGGVGWTVMELAAGVTTKGALVVLGDTHFQLADAAILTQGRPFVLVSPVEDSYRWCIAETSADGTVQKLRDKEQGLAGPLDALIGVYGFPDVDALRYAAGAASSIGGTVELKGILDAIPGLLAVRAGDWLDCGNADRQAASHRALLQRRAFNELSIDPVLGTITKRSQHTEKFIDEINYLRLMPADLSVLFPRLLGYSTDWADPHHTTEYYGYPTLAEVFLFENVDPGIWERVFLHLRDILAHFARRQRPLPAGALREMYLGKTRRRLQALDGELGELARHEGTVVVNGREVANLPLLWPRLEAEVARLEKSTTATIIHGDLCLSNILYDLRSHICKLIDPRGSFGAAGIFGDPAYDVAKLHHSVHGLYDFITNDLFRVRLEGNRLELDIRSRPSHARIEERFRRVFAPSRDVQLITGLLFASMPALHYDRPARQLAMYARSLQLLDEAYQEER